LTFFPIIFCNHMVGACRKCWSGGSCSTYVARSWRVVLF